MPSTDGYRRVSALSFSLERRLAGWQFRALLPNMRQFRMYDAKRFQHWSTLESLATTSGLSFALPLTTGTRKLSTALCYTMFGRDVSCHIS